MVELGVVDSMEEELADTEVAVACVAELVDMEVAYVVVAPVDNHRLPGVLVGDRHRGLVARLVLHPQLLVLRMQSLKPEVRSLQKD